MPIELSNLTFTNQADVVPMSGVEQILNTGIANTLAGNDTITGIKQVGTPIETSFFYAIFNDQGLIDTGDGNDIITGINKEVNSAFGISGYRSTINTGNGNDIITGIIEDVAGSAIQMIDSIINTGDGDDVIMGKVSFDSITSDAITNGLDFSLVDLSQIRLVDTGNGNDTIMGIGDTGISNFSNTIKTGEGNDVITGISTSGGFGILNTGNISLGNGNDVIVGKGAIYGIYNGGTIDTGNGADSIIVEGGFEGSLDRGNVFLGNGKDYFKGFGTGNFNGGNGQDTLELTPGSYTVGLSGTAVNFTKGSTIMNTSEFEILIAGNTIYDFASLTAGQIIVVA
jgi:Ca2+-binding RTX toxin-like protein